MYNNKEINRCTILIIFTIMIFSIIRTVNTANTGNLYYEGYDREVFPKSFPGVLSNKYSSSSSNDKFVPPHVWIAVRNISDKRPNHLAGFVSKNSNWTVHYCDNAEKDRFMNDVFFNTSTLWAYNVLNPLLGN